MPWLIRFRTLLCFVLIFAFSTACIHTPSSESKSVAASDVEKNANVLNLNWPFRIQSLVYSSAVLPLEDFFHRVRTGEFRDAIRKLDFRYHPSTTDNEVLKQLIDAGVIPVYAKIENVSGASQEISEQNFSIFNGKTRIAPIPAESLPTELSHFNAGALAANVWNIGVVITSMAALVGVMWVLATTATGSPDYSHLGSFANSGAAAAPDTRVYNRVTMRTQIDYHEFIIGKRVVKPGETFEGLLMFFDKGDGPIQNYRLEYSALGQK